MSKAASPQQGWTVTFAGTGINLALGILYTWSIFKSEITRSIVEGTGGFNWDPAAVNDPYAVCCLVFALSMIPAGKSQDRLGPRITAMIGGALVGLGFLFISFSTNYWIWVIGFGVMAGAGIGCGYSSAAIGAVKGFPGAKTGLAAGLVASGFGLAPAYISPLANHYIEHHGLSHALLIFGIAAFIMVCLLSLLLSNAPTRYAARSRSSAKALRTKSTAEASAGEMLKSSTFYLIWMVCFIGAGAGLMVIGSIDGMAKQNLSDMAFLAVVMLAVGNTCGRIAAGSLSDRIGRENTLALMLGIQALLMFAAIAVVDNPAAGAAILLMLAILIGFNYGTSLSLLHSLTTALWGLKNFGLNYGLVFSSWGVGGFVFSRIYQMHVNASGGQSFTPFMAAGILLLLGIGLTFLIKKQVMAAAHAEKSPKTSTRTPKEMRAEAA